MPTGRTSEGSGSSKRGLFADVQTNRHGVTAAVIKYTKGSRGFHEDDPIETLADSGTLYVKSRVISAGGSIDKRPAHSRMLAGSAADKG